MDKSPQTQDFHYTYSAKEQEEIRRIRERYAAPAEPAVDKMEQLRRLDAGVTQKGSVAALVLGIVGTLIMGLGMSLVMSDLSVMLGAWEALALPIGVVIGVVGMVPVAIAYPVYRRITARERARIAPEILRLTEELMK